MTSLALVEFGQPGNVLYPSFPNLPGPQSPGGGPAAVRPDDAACPCSRGVVPDFRLGSTLDMFADAGPDGDWAA